MCHPEATITGANQRYNRFDDHNVSTRSRGRTGDCPRSAIGLRSKVKLKSPSHAFPPCPMELSAARQLLDTYSCIEPKIPATERDRAELRTAILLIAQEAESENLGISAENAAIAYTTLVQYLQALGDKAIVERDPAAPQAEPVYLKYNTSTGKHYINPYEGDYRGVLLACQSEEDVVNGIFGYFPLDLFASV